MASLLEKTKHRARRTENLSGQVYNQIKTLILGNEILPGQKLHHQELSERLGVSRTPVREALTVWFKKGTFPSCRTGVLPVKKLDCKRRMSSINYAKPWKLSL